jgi:hypothetical protein
MLGLGGVASKSLSLSLWSDHRYALYTFSEKTDLFWSSTSIMEVVSGEPPRVPKRKMAGWLTEVSVSECMEVLPGEPPRVPKRKMVGWLTEVSGSERSSEPLKVLKLVGGLTQ